MRARREQQPYTYYTTEYRPERRTKEIRRCRYVSEQRMRDVSKSVCVPTTVTKTFNITRYRTVPATKTVNYTVLVPRQVERQVQIPVCHMVERIVPFDANACVDECCGGCGAGQGLFGGRRRW
jgi:hypothetical protein